MGAKTSAEVKKAHKIWLTGASVPNAARLANVHKVTLYNYLRRLQIFDFQSNRK